MSEKSGGIRRFEAGFGATGEGLPVMPLRIVVVSELTSRDLRTGRSAGHRRLVAFDRQSFDEAMAKLALRAFLDVPDRLTGSQKPLILELAIPDLKAFRPDAVAAAIPAGRDLLKLRAALTELRAGRAKLADVKGVLDGLETRTVVAESVRRALETPAAPPPAAAAATAPAQAGAGGDLDAILGMVDARSGAGVSAGADLARLDAVIRHIVRSERTAERVDGRAVDAAVTEIDAALSEQVDEVLHHPEFRRLEASWRGLRFLTDRTDFEQPIRIDVLATGRETLLADFDELVYGPESRGISAEPTAIVIVDMEFDRTPQDVELLMTLSERGAALSAVVLTSVGAPFLGLAKAGDLARKSGLKDAFTSPEFVKFKGLREAGPSRWLGVVFNRFLLRGGYGPDGSHAARSFQYVERIPKEADHLHLWGNPAFALGVLATRSFGRIGWCTDIMGQRASGTIEDLPLRAYERPGTEAVAFPLETVITDEIERDLSNNGVMTLSAALNSDRASLRFAPSAHAPQHYQDPSDKARARLQSTLPFQLFVGRLVNYAMLIEGAIVPGRTAEQVTASYDRALRGLIATAGAVPPDAVQVAIEPNEQDASARDLHLKVRWPGFQSLPGAGELELRWPLAG